MTGEGQKTIRVLEWNPSRAARDISLFTLFQIPCSVTSNSLFFWNRELPSNRLKYRRLPREKTVRSAPKWPNSLFFPVIHGFQPRPDSSNLHHPPFKCFKLLIIGNLFMSLLLDSHIYNPISTGGNKPSIVSQLGSPSRRTGYCQLRHHHPGQVREPLRAGPPVVLPGARRLCG